MGTRLYTIGHSTLPIEKFLAVLIQHGVTAVCDVRSSPFSQRNPQFNRESLKASLRGCGISYVFLGKELGGRAADPALYRDGQVQYDLVADTPLFREGLERVKRGLDEYVVAIMCAEADPLDCHRTLLVSRHLDLPNVKIVHILPDGRLEPHEDTERRLLRATGVRQPELFESIADTLERAYQVRAKRIAYSSVGARGSQVVDKFDDAEH